MLHLGVSLCTQIQRPTSAQVHVFFAMRVQIRAGIQALAASTQDHELGGLDEEVDANTSSAGQRVRCAFVLAPR